MLVHLDEFKASAYWKDSFSDEQVEKALSYAERRFYALTKREQYGYWFEPKRCVLRLDGTGTSLLQLAYPLVNLVDVRILYAAGALLITDFCRFRGHFLHYVAGEFPEGVMNVQVTGDFGDPKWNGTVPDDVKEAVMRLAFMKLRRHYRIAGEELLERRAPDQPPPPVTYTGDREVDGIIATYTIKPPVFLDIRGPISPEEALGSDEL
jgi:hypothetical protein